MFVGNTEFLFSMSGLLQIVLKNKNSYIHTFTFSELNTYVIDEHGKLCPSLVCVSQWLTAYSDVKKVFFKTRFYAVGYLLQPQHYSRDKIPDHLFSAHYCEEHRLTLKHFFSFQLIARNICMQSIFPKSCERYFNKHSGFYLSQQITQPLMKFTIFSAAKVLGFYFLRINPSPRLLMDEHGLFLLLSYWNICFQNSSITVLVSFSSSLFVEIKQSLRSHELRGDR